MPLAKHPFGNFGYASSLRGARDGEILMYVHRHSLRITVMLMVASISACSVTQAPKSSEENQQAALQRWHQCIETNRVGFEGNAVEMHKVVALSLIHI